MRIDDLISELVAYSVERELIEPQDEAYAVGRLMEILQVSDYAPAEKPSGRASRAWKA